MELTHRKLIALGFVVGLVIAPSAGALTAFLSNGVHTEDVTLAPESGPAVTVTGATTSDLSSFDPYANTVEWETADGNLTVEGAAGTELSVAASDLQADTVNYTALNLSAGEVTISHETHADLTLGGDVSWFEHDEVALDDGQADIRYAAPSGTTDVTLRGLPSDKRVGVVDVNSERVLAADDTGAAGVADVTLPDSKHYVQLMTSRQAAELSDPSATGDLSRPPSALSVQLNDTDYPYDNHTVTFVLDGQQVAEKSVNRNKTVTANIDGENLTGGEHTWTVEATDGYGNTITKSSSFRVPAELDIRNESDPDQLVDNSSADVTFYGDGEVITREAPNGTVSLEGLSVGQQFAVSADAEGYNSRTATLDSLYQQESVYLLPDNTSTVEVRFTLEDNTGLFPSDSTLFVDRVLERNNTTAYRTIVSDEFGVQGVTTQLEEGERYQLRIRNPQGDVVSLGSYTADVSETVPLSPAPASSAGAAKDNSTNSYDAYREDNAIQIEYFDPSDSTSHLSVSVHERRNESNQLVPTRTYYDLGNLSLSEPLSPKEQNMSWVVVFKGEFDGEAFIAQVTVGDGPMNLVPGELDEVWRVTVGVFVLLTSSMIFSRLNVGVGMLTTSLSGGILWWIGLLDGVATGASVVFSIGVSIVYNVMIRR